MAEQSHDEKPLPWHPLYGSGRSADLPLAAGNVNLSSLPQSLLVQPNAMNLDGRAAPVSSSGVEWKMMNLCRRALCERVNAGYQFTQGVKMSVEMLNALDKRANDITYFYESQLRGEPELVEGIHFNPVEPHAARLHRSKVPGSVHAAGCTGT